MQKRTNDKGFSILELVITIAVLAVLVGVGSGFYRGITKNAGLTTIARTMSADLRYMQSKSMAGESGLKWGVHFVNDTTDYYELFSTPTVYADVSMTVNATTTLPTGISFSDPSDSTNEDIIFTKISGTTTVASISIISDGLTQTINVSGIGTIY